MRWILLAGWLGLGSGCSTPGYTPPVSIPDAPPLEAVEEGAAGEELAPEPEPAPEPRSSREGSFFVRPALELGAFLPETGRFENYFIYGGTAGLRIARDLILEISLLRSTFDVEARAAPDSDGEVILLSSNLRYFLTDLAGVRPFVLGGAGYDWLTVDPKTPGLQRRRREGPGATAGLGVEVPIQKRVRVALELRYHRAFENVDERFWIPLLSAVLDL